MTAISIYLHATDAENCANLLWKGPLVSPDAMVVVHHHSYSMHSSNGFFRLLFLLTAAFTFIQSSQANEWWQICMLSFY